MSNDTPLTRTYKTYLTLGEFLLLAFLAAAVFGGALYTADDTPAPCVEVR